jgi:hypothetical protein
MAFEIYDDAITRVAAADLVQYRAAALDGSGNAAVPGAGARTFGVVQFDVASGKAASLLVEGVSKMEAGAPVAMNALITCDNLGRAVTATTGDFVIGEALLAAAASGRIISVRLGAEHKAQA